MGDLAEGEGFGLWGRLKERKSEVPVVAVAGVVELRPASRTGSVSGLDSGSEGPLNKKREVERNEGLRCESVTVVVMSLQRKTPRRFFLGDFVLLKFNKAVVLDRNDFWREITSRFFFYFESLKLFE